jgi:hypothetical protein
MALIDEVEKRSGVTVEMSVGVATAYEARRLE